MLGFDLPRARVLTPRSAPGEGAFMTREGSLDGHVAYHCNFCTAQTLVPIECGPDRWIGLGRDVHLCIDCAQRRRCAIGLMDKIAALPPTLLEVVVRVIDKILHDDDPISPATSRKDP